MLLADSSVPSPPVELHQLLTSWQFDDNFAVVALAIQLLAAGAYTWGVIRLRRRRRRWSPWRSAAFMSGVLTLSIAVVSGLASYDDEVFVVHVIQHLLIMMVAPPLLSLGAPITLAIQSGNRRLQTRIVRLLHSPILRTLTIPLVAALLYYVAMYVDFLTSFYKYSLQHQSVHDISHVVLFVFGCLFWWPMVAVDQLPDRPGYGARIFFMFIGMPFEVFLGVAIMNDRIPIAPEHTLSDTHAGGAVFWASSMMITFASALLILTQWWNQEQRRSASEATRPGAREARRLEAWEAAWAGRPPPSRPAGAAQAPEETLSQTNQRRGAT